MNDRIAPPACWPVAASPAPFSAEAMSRRSFLRTTAAAALAALGPAVPLQAVKSNFFTGEQQALIRAIFQGMTNPDWHARFDQQLKDDVGGFGW